MAVPAPEVGADHLPVRVEGVVFVQEPHVGRLPLADVDVAVELLDDVVEPEAADPLVGRRWRPRLNHHWP